MWIKVLIKLIEGGVVESAAVSTVQIVAARFTAYKEVAAEKHGVAIEAVHALLVYFGKLTAVAVKQQIYTVGLLCHKTVAAIELYELVFQRNHRLAVRIHYAVGQPGSIVYYGILAVEIQYIKRLTKRLELSASVAKALKATIRPSSI